MEDRLLVEALRSRDPAAVGAVYDDYADRLYGYCWFQLRNGDSAQVTLRDTMMCAEAHIAELSVPARFGPWLYALARIECRRRRSAGPVQPDIPVARHDQDDADLRLMAWRAVTALPPLSSELLDLRYRHELTEGDIALVVGLPAKEVGELLGQARVLLEAALIAEILAHEGPFGCDARAAILRHHAGEVDDDLREALVRHSAECPVCGRHLLDAIAPAKVYALLPCAVPPQALRRHITSCFTDPDLAGYRLFAAARISRFGAHGFPAQPGVGRAVAYHRAACRWPRAAAAVAGALIAAATASVLCRWFGQEASHDGGGVLAGPPHSRAPLPSPAPPGMAHLVSVAFPLGAREPAGPAVATGSPLVHLLPGPAIGRLEVVPGRLTLGPGGAGAVTVRAVGGGVDWQGWAAGPLRLAPGGGGLGPGGTQTVSVQATDGHHPGTAVITFQPGGAQVLVSWGGAASSPPASPTPSPTSSPTSSPGPTTPPPPSPGTPPPGQGTPPPSPRTPPATPGKPPTDPAPPPPSSSPPPATSPSARQRPAAPPPSGSAR